MSRWVCGKLHYTIMKSVLTHLVYKISNGVDAVLQREEGSYTACFPFNAHDQMIGTAIIFATIMASNFSLRMIPSRRYSDHFRKSPLRFTRPIPHPKISKQPPSESSKGVGAVLA